MFVASSVVSGLLAVVLSLSALAKLSHKPRVVAMYARVGVPERRLNLLAGLLLLAALGLSAGVFWPVLGVAAAAGLVGYFSVAIAFHLRFADVRGLPVPVVLLAGAVAALALRIATFGERVGL